MKSLKPHTTLEGRDCPMHFTNEKCKARKVKSRTQGCLEKKGGSEGA